MIKKYFYYISLIILLISCEKFFHPDEYLISKIDNTNELEQALGGAYGLLVKAYNHHLGGYGFYMASLKGDDLNLPHANYHTIYWGDENNHWEPSSNYYDYEEAYRNALWEDLYRLIITLNNMIIQFPEPLSAEKAYRELIGEAYILRAYSYFRLVRTYEKIVLVEDIEIDYTHRAASPGEVYAFMEQDLVLAQKLLPPARQQSRIPGVTPHRGVAKALLAEVYLNWAGYPIKDEEKYALAAKIAGEVIDSADYFGFDLMLDFVSLWDSSDYYNHESIFTIYFSDPLLATSVDEINQVYREWYHDDLNGDFCLDPSSSLDFYYFPCERNFFNGYPEGYRKDITFFTHPYVITKCCDTIEGYYDTIKFVPSSARVAYHKFYFTTNIVDHILNSPYLSKRYLGNSKVYLFRYAHTLLTYAEASTRSGNLTALSYECVNKIRRRARHLDIDQLSQFDLNAGLSIEAFLDSVVWERAWEFAGEPEGRWFDLVRLEKVEELNYLRDPYENGPPELPFTKEDYFFPIPNEEYYLNPNL